eukprot:5267410-Ditylum_brightwellii.AAC.1
MEATKEYDSNDELSTSERRVVDYQDNPTQLFVFINHQDWHGARDYVEKEPDEASIWISSTRGMLFEYSPLHIACQNSSRDGVADLIDSLVCAYPEATSSPDSSNELPIHHAIRSNASAETIGTLICVYPPSINIPDAQGNTPLAFILSSGEEG